MSSSQLPTVDEETLLSTFQGLENVLLDAARDFLRLSPEWVNQIDVAIKKSSSGELERSAHSLKGAASNFQATEVMERAKVLEMMGRSGSTENAGAAFSDLQDAMKRLNEYLRLLPTRISAS